jgi:hypothetical protein
MENFIKSWLSDCFDEGNHTLESGKIKEKYLVS